MASNMPLTPEERSLEMMQCNLCRKSAIFKCSDCEIGWYCSKECQKVHWKIHKPACREASKRREASRQLDTDPTMAALITSRLPQGVTSLVEYGDMLARFIRAHHRTTATAIIHSLRLPENPIRAKDFVLIMDLAGRPLLEHQGDAAKFFRVVDARVIKRSDACTKFGVTDESLAKTNMDAGRGGVDSVSFLGFACVPLLSTAVIPKTATVEILRSRGPSWVDWKQRLITDVEAGKEPSLINWV